MMQLHSTETETTDLLRRSVRQFAETEIAPLAENIDRNNIFPRVLWPKLGALGLLGITVEECDGGAGQGYLEHVIAMEEISRASAAIGLSYGAHSNLCVNQIRLNGTTEQRKKYLPKLCTGEWVGALAMSETNAGSDVMNLQCRAEKQANGFLLNGTKMWTTNGFEADVLVVYARTDKSAGSHGITAFIIEKKFPGFSTAQKLDKLGMRGSDTCELIFENCLVPNENMLGEVNHGTRVLMKGLDYERLILAAGPVGIMQACMDLVLPYVRTRKQFGKPIGEFQLMQGKLADMYVALMSSRAWLYALAQSADQNALDRKDAAAIILYTAEQATQMALQTIQCLGGNGYINDFPSGRLLRDAKLYEIGAGTSEIRRMLIGRTLFEEESP
ncbi:MAG: isovaleryl-CoA dehydrogenase [Gammaproteobacteria bacterium]|nr:isovaleryl-CoA dehydrogenase [Gammaproteobacteria bacterium]